MRVADYRYIDNAAALGRLGFLADDRDVSRRQTQLPRHDDPAFFYEGIAERCDLVVGYKTAMSLMPKLSHWGYNAPLNVLTSSSVELDSRSALAALTPYIYLRPFTPTTWQNFDADVNLRLGGARTPRTAPSGLVGNRLPWYGKIRAASDVLYDYVTFRTSSPILNYSIEDDPDTPSGRSGSVLYGHYLDKPGDGSAAIDQEWGDGTSITLTATKTAGSTQFSDARYQICFAVLMCVFRRSWLDRGTREQGSQSEYGYSFVRLYNNGDDYTITTTPPSRSQMKASLVDALGAAPSLSEDSRLIESVEFYRFDSVVLFLSPNAVAARKFN